MVAIEKLIGQAIPRVDSGVAIRVVDGPAAPSSGEPERPRQSRGREGARDGAKDGSREGSRGGRKPRREREPRRPGGGRSPGPQPQPPVAAFTPPVAPPASRTPSIGRAVAPQAPRDPALEPADHSHLPAFLLRPVRARV